MKLPWLSFIPCCVLNFATAICCFSISDKIDNNPMATGIDVELKKYNEKQRALYPEKYSEDSEVELPPFYDQVIFKLKSIWKCLKIKPIRKFILYQCLMGLCMPCFPAFGYYFAVDHLKIPLDMMNTQSLWLCWIGFLIPTLYYKFFYKRNFVWMIFTAHMIFIFGDSIGVFVALGLHEKYGIPAKFVYVFCCIVGTVDGGLVSFPTFMFFGKVVP